MASNQAETDAARQKAAEAVFVPTQSSHGFNNKVQGDSHVQSFMIRKHYFVGTKA